MLLTEQQIHEIRDIIQDYHTAFVVNVVGPDAVPANILKKLADKGLVNVQVNSIEDAYLYGQALAMMDDPQFAGMTFDQFKAYLQKNPIPLSPIEKQAVNFAKQQAAQAVRGLGNRVEAKTNQILIEADAAQRQALRDTIRTKTAENIAKRESLQKLRSDLGWASGDWARDWQRIANTEKQNAMQRGVADHYAGRYGGEVRVSKRPMPDACKHCKRLHLGPDGQPYIFKLSWLEANGTNVGRKAAEWLPVVGTVHPHCQCQLVRVPDGWGYDDDGSLVPGGKGGKEYDSPEEVKKAVRRKNDLQKAMETQGRLTYQGIPIVLENLVGDVREWRDGEGGVGRSYMHHAYGYIPRTVGADEDPVDVYLGPDPDAEMAYVVHQRNVKTDLYDEDKVMLGFSNEGEALRAYLRQYNRPDFAIGLSAMPLDAFKRWLEGTVAGTGEMFKAGQRATRFVIPIQKSLESTVAASGATSTAARSGPTTGTGSNYLFNAPNRGKAPKLEGIKEFLEALLEDETGLRRDKEVYHFTEPQRAVHPIILPARHPGDSPLETGETEERRRVLDQTTKRRKAVVRNTVEPEDSASLEKAKHVTPIGGVTPGGYKKVGKDKYVPIEDAKAAVDAFAKEQDGKLAAHKTDPQKHVVKFGSGRKDYVETLKAEEGFTGEVIVGSQYVMIALDDDELHRLYERIKQEKAKQAEAKSAIEEKKDKQKPGYGTPPKKTYKGLAPRLDSFVETTPDQLALPPVRPGLLQRGSQVRVTRKGKSYTAKLDGFAFHGAPIVRKANGETRMVQWSEVEPLGDPPPYRPSYADLTPGALVVPGEREQKLLAAMGEFKVVGDHTASEYIAWLRGKGQEVYYVGGTIRDMLAGTAAGSSLTDDQVLAQMQDVDLVSTAHVELGKRMLAEVAPEFKDGGLAGTGGVAWGVVRSLGHGLGLDFSAMASGDNAFTKQQVYDHDIFGDTTRRDFTCNALYYDPVNGVIIDPTGQGIADAQNRVLRMANTPEQAKDNNSLHFRFWKFRARGYIPEEETLKYVREHAKQWLEREAQSEDGHSNVLWLMYKAIGKSGDPAKNLEKFREVMKEDGCLDLFDQYLEPIRDQIIKYCIEKGPEHG